MKRATFSGIRSILCELLLAALLLGLSGCAAGTTAAVADPTPISAPAETPEPVDTENDSAIEPEPAEYAEVSEEAQPTISGVEISFDFTRMSTHASNQLAIWVENADGELIKTVFVTNFASARRGYRSRDMAISHWVGAANPEAMSDGQIDAISGATPSAGRLTYSWDLTDQNGDRVPDGVYTIYLEGTLYWESNVLFIAVIDTRATEPGELPVEMLRSEPDNSENETMLKSVRIAAIA